MKRKVRRLALFVKGTQELQRLRTKMGVSAMAAGGNAFGIRALNKSADIIAAFGEKITSGKQLSSLKGIGKGTVAKVISRARNLV